MMMATQPMKQIIATCVRCGESTIINAVIADLIKWKNGECIQNAMPYLNADEREILISKTCGDCFDEIFGESNDWD